VNRNIIQNSEMAVEDKARGMRDFVLKMHEIFLRKVPLNSFRTKSCRSQSHSRPTASTNSWE
jgi:hypothetical protein